MKYVIIGYSVAAVNAIKAIREHDKNSEIIVLTDEDKLYSRPLISYYLAGKVKNDLSFVDGDFDKKYNLNVYYSTSVKTIDVKKKKVIVDKNKFINYDKLLISVGGTPIIPPIEGYKKEIKGIFTFTKLEDAVKLSEYIKKNKIKEAVILGGGLIGIKAAEGLLDHNIKLKIIDIADRLLSNTFDKDASLYIENRLKEYNSEFIPLDTVVKIISKNKSLNSVILKSGKKLKTKLLIIAVGVKPNLSIVENAGIKTNKGILVDEYMQTNIKDIFAAGDVVESVNFVTGEKSVIAIWPAAALQGRVAGLNMVGKETKYEGFFPMNSVEVLGIPSISFGITNVSEHDKNYEVLVRKEKCLYKKFVLKDNKIVGVVLVGNIERAGIYGLLIRQKIDVSNFKNELLSDDFGFLVLPKDFRKHFVSKVGIEV